MKSLNTNIAGVFVKLYFVFIKLLLNLAIQGLCGKIEISGEVRSRS